MALPYNIVLLTQTNGGLFGQPIAFALDTNLTYLYSLISGGVTVNTIRNGNGPPSGGLGSDGDFYIDDVALAIYGPKTAGSWGSATALVGPAGTNGTNGYTIRNGSGAPSTGLGVNGDFYIDNSVHAIYGPKSGGAWGSPTSLIGPSGPGGGNVNGPGSTTVGRIPQWSGTLVLADGLDIGVASGTNLLNRNGGDGRYDALGAAAAVTPTTLGLVIGTNVQAQSALLSSIVGLSTATDKLMYFSGVNTPALTTYTAQARTFDAAVDAPGQRSVLGLGTSATLNTGTTAGCVVVLNGSAQLPAVDGSLLTNLPAGTVTSSQITTALGYVPTSVTGLTGAQTVGGFKAGLSLVSGDVGLGNVNNTSDANKPVSTAQAAAIALKLTASNNLSDLTSASTARSNLGLGSAATLTAGTSANNAVQLDGSARLPAVDGSQLTNLPSGTSLKFAQVQDQKSSGTNGSTYAGGSFAKVDLNTEVYDPNNLVTVASNQISINVAGTYLIEAITEIDANLLSGQFFIAAQLYDASASATIARGPNAYVYCNGTDNPSTNTLTAQGFLVVSSAKLVEFQIYCGNGYRIGRAVSQGTEVYTNILLTKIA